MRLSLSQKLSLGPLGVAILSGVLTFGYLLPRMQDGFDKQGEELGAKLPAALASLLMERVLRREAPEIQKAIDEVAEKSHVAYIAVIDSEGELIAASGELGAVLREQHRELLTNDESRTLQLQGTEILSLQAPVLDGTLGHVHVGFPRSAVRARLQTLTLRFGGVLFVALLAFSLAAYLFSRRLVAPLLRLTQVARRIADQGDLREAIQVDSMDEVGQLSQAFASMVNRLKEVLHELQFSSELMTQSVRVLSHSASDQSRMASRYASALHQTQATAQELHRTSSDASETAESVLKVAARADDLGKTGSAAISESINGLVEMLSQVKQIAAQITSLGERTRQIGGITQTVKDLADQSHMLALNAAIEAARSGEHGKGFAVVAREIRSLADLSVGATARVQEILEDISRAISNTVETSEHGAREVEGGLAQVRTTGDNLRALAALVHENGLSVREIAETVSRQDAGIAQLFDALKDLSALSQETVTRLQATEQAASRLSGASREIRAMVGKYKL